MTTQFIAVESILEDGSKVADLCLMTPHVNAPMWDAPTASTATNAAYILNAVYARLVACGSDREVARLVDRIQEVLG